MECCALGEGHDIPAYCSCIRTFCIAAIDRVQIARCHVARQFLQIDMNSVILRAAVCASCIATIRLERCSVGDALDVQYIALGCRADSDIMPVLVLLRMIVAGVAAVYLGGRLRLRSFMGHLIVAETVQLKQYLVCRRIRRACSGCDICRHLFLVDAVDLCDSCRIRIVREGEIIGIGDRCSCARYGFLHQCEVISAVDAPATPIRQLGGICLDLPPINLHSRVRCCIRDGTKPARLGKREHRIFVLEIVAEDKGIRIEVANLLRRYSRRRDDQLVIFDLVTGTVKGQLRCSCNARRHVTVVRPVDGRTCNVHAQRAGRLLRADHHTIPVRERMRCRGRCIVHGTCACDLARHRAAAHLNFVLRRRSIHLVHSTAVDIRHRAAIDLGFVLGRLAAILCGDAAIDIRDAAAANDRLVAPCLALIALSVATIKTFGHRSIVDNSFISCGDTCRLNIIANRVRCLCITTDNLFDLSWGAGHIVVGSVYDDMIVLRICQTVGFAAVCRLKILLDPIYREIIIVGIMLVIGNTTEYLISLAGILCGIIVPDIVLELCIGQKQSLSLRYACLCRLIQRIRRKLKNILDVLIAILIRQINTLIGVIGEPQWIRRIPLNKGNLPAGIPLLHEFLFIFNFDLAAVNCASKSVLRNRQHLRAVRDAARNIEAIVIKPANKMHRNVLRVDFQIVVAGGCCCVM